MKKASGNLNSGSLRTSNRPSTGKLISSFYQEIEFVLDRVERAASHYHSLGVDRNASNEEIVAAYQKTVLLLHPSYYKVRAAVPDELLTRIDKTFKRISLAFFVLTNPGKRSEYDRYLRQHAPAASTKARTSPAAQPAEQQKSSPPPQPASSATDADAITLKSAMARPIFSKPADDAAVVNRRRCARYKLAIPVRVAGYDASNQKWNEVTKTIDVNRLGIGVTMVKRVMPGTVLHLMLPLPTKLRAHGYSDPGYSVYAIVRRVEPSSDGARVVGLEFLGERPPGEYLAKPWATFRTERWNGVERRREQRAAASETVVIEYLTDSNQAISRETSQAENVSPGGIRVRVKAAPPAVDYVKVISQKRRFEAVAAVRNRISGKDGCERLCLQFVDKKWPTEKNDK